MTPTDIKKLIQNGRTTDFRGEPELKNRLEVDEVTLVLPIHRFEGTAPKIAPKKSSQSVPISDPKMPMGD